VKGLVYLEHAAALEGRMINDDNHRDNPEKRIGHSTSAAPSKALKPESSETPVNIPWSGKFNRRSCGSERAQKLRSILLVQRVAHLQIPLLSHMLMARALASSSAMATLRSLQVITGARRKFRILDAEKLQSLSEI